MWATRITYGRASRSQGMCRGGQTTLDRLHIAKWIVFLLFFLKIVIICVAYNSLTEHQYLLILVLKITFHSCSESFGLEPKWNPPRSLARLFQWNWAFLRASNRDYYALIHGAQEFSCESSDGIASLSSSSATNIYQVTILGNWPLASRITLSIWFSGK